MLFLYEIKSMTERIEQLMSELRSTSLELKNRLKTEQVKQAELEAENRALKQEISAFQSEVEANSKQIQSLSSELELVKNNSGQVPAKQSVSKEEIDELVNEIEYCITQLKQ